MSDRSTQATPAASIARGQRPVSSPQVRWLAILLSIVLIAIGVVAIRELIIRWFHPADWKSWLLPVPDAVATLHPIAYGAIGACVAIIGIWFVLASVWPRRARHRELPGTSASVWVRPVDIARFTTANAKHVSGVVSARSQATKKKVKVNVFCDTADTAAQEALRAAVQKRLDAAFQQKIPVTVTVSLSEEVRESLPTGNIQHGSTAESWASSEASDVSAVTAQFPKAQFPAAVNPQAQAADHTGVAQQADPAEFPANTPQPAETVEFPVTGTRRAKTVNQTQTQQAKGGQE